MLLATIISLATSLSSGLPRLRSLIATRQPAGLAKSTVDGEAVVVYPCTAEGLPRRPSQAQASCQSSPAHRQRQTPADRASVDALNSGSIS